MVEFVIYSYAGIIAVVFLKSVKEKILYSKSFPLVFLMGFFTTLPHELAHFIAALLLGGRPRGIYLIPKKVEYEDRTFWTFGSVEAYVNSFNGFFIGIAPVIWLVAGYFIAKYYFLLYSPQNLESVIMFFIIEYLCIENGLPSSADLKIAFSSGVGLFAAVIMLTGGYIWIRG